MADSSAEKKNRKKVKREARLWEDTIVIALRDAQWLRRQEQQVRHTNEQPPEEPLNGAADPSQTARPVFRYAPGFIKFDGRAESALGDLGLAMGERLFLIEVKSGREQVRDEWTKKKGTFKAKKVYARLSTLVTQCNEKSRAVSVKDTLDRLLISSLYGHYVAYWETLRDSKSEKVRKAIVLVPYLQAMINSRTDDDDHQEGMITRMPVSSVCAGTMREKEFFRATVNDLGRDDCLLIYRNYEGRAKLSKKPIGLDAPNFQAYVNFLCGGPDHPDGYEHINAVMLSSHGTFFQVLSNTRELAWLLSAKLTQQANWEPKEEDKDAEELGTDHPSP